MGLPEVDPSEALPRVHTAISNAKRNMLGVYHKISDKYMQSYLNELAYKFNRRHFADTLTRVFTACVGHDKAKNQHLLMADSHFFLLKRSRINSVSAKKQWKPLSDLGKLPSSGYLSACPSWACSVSGRGHF